MSQASSITLTDHLRILSQKITSAALALGRSECHISVQKLYRVVLLSWFFLHTAILIPYHAQIWGPDAYMINYPFDSGRILSWLTDLLSHHQIAPYYLVFVVGQLVSLGMAIFGFKPRLMMPLIWFFTQNLNAKAGVIMDGGNNLSEILLFYLLFMNTSGAPLGLEKYPKLRALAVGFSNAAFFLSRFQVFIVYLTVGLYKLNGGLWQNGMALYYILQSKDYTHPTLGGFLVAHPWLAMAGTYYTLVFQAMFPYFVWNRRTRPLILLMGTTLHLGIAFVMGLFTFGLVMCASYFVFFREPWARFVLETCSARTPVVAGVDSSCRFCMVWAKAMKFLVRGDLLVVDDALDPSNPVLAAVTARAKFTGMVVIDAVSGETSTGFEAVRRLCSRSVILAPLSMALAVLAYLGLGDKLYNAITARRQRLGGGSDQCILEGKK